jgi:Tfp pilus assembly protein PilN
MLRINLLPPEIIERRKWERFYPYVFLAVGLLVIVVLVVWSGLQITVNQRNDVLQQTKTTTEQLSAQAEAFSIFERKQQELEARRAIADAALAGRVDMARLAEDVSLVLPDETFLVTLSCDEEQGLSLAAHAAL